MKRGHLNYPASLCGFLLVYNIIITINHSFPVIPGHSFSLKRNSIFLVLSSVF